MELQPNRTESVMNNGCTPGYQTAPQLLRNCSGTALELLWGIETLSFIFHWEYWEHWEHWEQLAIQSSTLKAETLPYININLNDFSNKHTRKNHKFHRNCFLICHFRW